ncbi:MAG: hypothetical protein KAR11_03415 [Phycisphaerae bacterium]|nr:hypothetical protein [Phycisphaerae bacterium]
MERIFGLLLLTSLIATAGCDIRTKGHDTATAQDVPAPINSLLPQTIAVHPFTQTNTFEQGAFGLHVRVQAKDSYGDPTKAFGDFRFELYEFRRQHQGKKGKKITQWEVAISRPKANLLHWDRHTRSYEFKLSIDKPIPKGTRLMLVVVFTSRFTPRLVAEREIVAGE